jgi:hypothetical protein
MNPADTLYITEKSGSDIAVASVGAIVNVKLSGLDWTGLKATGEDDARPVLRRQAAQQTSADASGVVFVAERAGTVKLSAHGRAHCQPGQMSPQFVVAWTKTITVTTTGKAAQP